MTRDRCLDALRVSKRSISGPEMRFSRQRRCTICIEHVHVRSGSPTRSGRMGRDTSKPHLFLRFEVTSDLNGHLQCRVTSL